MLVLVVALAAFAAGSELNATESRTSAELDAKNSTLKYTAASPGIVIDGEFKYGIVAAPFTVCYRALEKDYFAEIATIECMAARDACSPLPMTAYLTDNTSIAPMNDDEYFTPPETSLQLVDNLIDFTAEMRVARTTVMHPDFRICIDTRSSGFWCKIDTMTVWVPRDNLPTDKESADTLNKDNVSESDPVKENDSVKDSSSGKTLIEENSSGENLSEDEIIVISGEIIIASDEKTASTQENDFYTETTDAYDGSGITSDEIYFEEDSTD